MGTTLHIPGSVASAPARSLCLVAAERKATFFVREDDGVLARYPQRCPVDSALAVWDDGAALCVVVLVRLAERNSATFERWLNVAAPTDMRLVQLLAGQDALEVVLVSENRQRSFRRYNNLASKATAVIATLRARPPWSAAQFEAHRERLVTLYPTAPALWRAARSLGK